MVDQNPRESTSNLANVVSEATGISVSTSTERCTLHQVNLHSRRPRKKPLLKPRHKLARLQFAQEYSDRPMSFWESILWSVKTKINLFGFDGVKMCGVALGKNTTRKTWYLLLNMVVAARWFGVV